VVLHDETTSTAAYPFALASLTRPDFPLPVGVLRAIEKSCYEDMLQEQVDMAIDQRGAGDLSALLHSGDTWTVDG
jgi:2-oxoglutarate ferredoxin oxidoreductase subunit beta